MSDNIMQLQLLQQNLQQYMMQKQQVQQEILEVDSALKELPSTSKAYQIVGKLMIAKNKEALIKDLEERKNVLTLRLSTITTQEDTIKKSLSEVQEKVMAEKKKE